MIEKDGEGKNRKLNIEWLKERKGRKRKKEMIKVKKEVVEEKIPKENINQEKKKKPDKDQHEKKKSTVSALGLY